MSKFDSFIGFPEGLLCDRPVRLRVLANESDWVVLQKASGFVGQVHPWYKNRPDVTSCIRSQIAGGKGELKRLGIGELFYICGPEPESPGPMLFAKNKGGADLLRNAFGSNLFQFTFWLIARIRTSESNLQCELPIADHTSEHRAVGSHRIGKKSITHFRRLCQGPECSLWEATTSLPRVHQVRLHASEVGLPLVGELLYSTENQESSQNQLPKRPNPGRFFKGLAILLHTLDLSRVFEGLDAITPGLPKPFEVFLKKSGLNQA